MDRKEFIKKYTIKNAVPIDPSLRIVPAEGFAIGVEEFINERFRGVAKASASVSSFDGILISPEYFAMFLKTMLTDIYGRCYLTVTIGADRERILIDISSDTPLPLSDRQMRNLIRLAKNSGMKISLEEGNIRLSALFSEAAMRRIYAISVFDGRVIILSKLNEIFYCGEDYE